MDSKEQKMMEYLILSGALEVAGVSESGDPLYNFTNKLKEVMPELYEEHLSYVNSEIMKLWEKGFVEINLLEENPVVRLSDLAFNSMALAELPEEDRFALSEIKRILAR